MATTTVENYLKQIYVAQLAGDAGRLVAMGDLASAVGVTAGTATTMVKGLGEAGYVHYTPRGGVRLTEDGERLARQILRRHRLIEQFLVEVVGLDWSEVHDEAEELEHAVSDKLLARMDALLGHPTTDPHGDPIPPDASLPRWHRRWLDSPEAGETLESLADCRVGRAARVSRVLEQTPDFLRFLNDVGLIPGATATVLRRDEAADSAVLKVLGVGEVTVGLAAAAKVLVGAVPASREGVEDPSPANVTR